MTSMACTLDEAALLEEVLDFLEGGSDQALEDQMRFLRFGWIYDLRRRWQGLNSDH